MKIYKKLKEQGFLIGWKEIANYLNVSPDSVRRNWRKWNLPLFFLENVSYKTPAVHIADMENWRKKKIEEARKKFDQN